MYSRLDVEYHGGGCCGIFHVFDFPDLEDFTLEDFTDDLERKPKLADKQEFIQDGISRTLRKRASHNNQMLIEAVLSSPQWTMWERALQSCGFKRVAEFLNSNSGNRCRVYHLKTN